MLKLFGIYRKLTGTHAVIQFVTEDDTPIKLKACNERFLGSNSSLLTLEEIKEPANWRRPFSEKEFVLKITPKYMDTVKSWRDGDTLVVWAKPSLYKFEKNKLKYHGWNITLKKFTKTNIL